jgi:hypothetical protein
MAVVSMEGRSRGLTVVDRAGAPAAAEGVGPLVAEEGAGTPAALSVVWPKKNQDGFLWFGLKIGSYGLVIWASKSPRRFLDLCLKTKQASVCRLRHKINRGRTA